MINTQDQYENQAKEELRQKIERNAIHHASEHLKQQIDEIKAWHDKVLSVEEYLGRQKELLAETKEQTRIWRSIDLSLQTLTRAFCPNKVEDPNELRAYGGQKSEGPNGKRKNESLAD